MTSLHEFDKWTVELTAGETIVFITMLWSQFSECRGLEDGCENGDGCDIVYNQVVGNPPDYWNDVCPGSYDDEFDSVLISVPGVKAYAIAFRDTFEERFAKVLAHEILHSRMDAHHPEGVSDGEEWILERMGL